MSKPLREIAMLIENDVKHTVRTDDMGVKHHSVKVGHSTGQYSEHPDHFEIQSVRTPTKHRKQGGAHAVMHHILQHVDKEKKPARLAASPLDKKTSTQKLVNFYQKHGFEVERHASGNVHTVNPMGDPWMHRKAKE